MDEDRPNVLAVGCLVAVLSLLLWLAAAVVVCRLVR